MAVLHHSASWPSSVLYCNSNCQQAVQILRDILYANNMQNMIHRKYAKEHAEMCNWYAFNMLATCEYMQLTFRFILSICHIYAIDMHYKLMIQYTNCMLRYAFICIYMPNIQKHACHTCLCTKYIQIYAGRNVHVVWRNMQMCILYADMCIIYAEICIIYVIYIYAPYMYQCANEQYAEICTYQYMLQYYGMYMQF